MTEKEYLLQARYLDERIHSKVQQVESLNDLATSCSAVISDMPRNPNRGGSKTVSYTHLTLPTTPYV